MRSYAYVSTEIEQLALFESQEQKCDTLYCAFVDGEIWQWLDREQTLFFGAMEDSPTARRIFENPPVYVCKGRFQHTFEKVEWLERNKNEGLDLSTKGTC